jgi:hypothetical protein
MNNLRTCKCVSRGWIVTALVLLLFAFPAALSAQKDKDKDKNKGSGQSHSGSSSGGAAGHQVQSHQAPSGGGQTHTTPSNSPNSGSHPNGPASPNPGVRSNTGQATPQNPGTRSNTGQATPQNTGVRSNTGQTTPRNAAQPGQQYGRPNSDRPNPQNASRPSPVQGGRQFGSGRPQTIRTANGGMVQRDAAGRINQVHTPGGAVITHRPDGIRRVEVQRPGGRLIVANEHGRGGYIQHPMMFHNQQFVQRTYYVHGVAYARVYRPYMFRGVALNIYTPVRFYRPGFYAYAYTPWGRPVFYNWGWFGTPWFGFYGGFFAPYPQYAGPAFWLTDYLIATTLQEAYQERLEANMQASAYAAGGPVGITPDVKQAVADEVHRQLDQERAEAQAGGAPSGGMPVFADNVQHVFVVSGSLMVDARGQSCPVTEGDVLQLVPGPSNGPAADTVVLASKGQDCPRGSVVTVQLQDLQEMQNHMRETIDQGLQTLQTRQGQAGLPPLPPSAAGAPVDSPIAAEVRPDANAATDISQVAQEGATAEQDVINQSGDAAGNASGPVTISLGQTIADVESVNGKPEKVIDLGPKKIYVYRDLKITFTDGKVSDVQ